MEGTPAIINDGEKDELSLGTENMLKLLKSYKEPKIDLYRFFSDRVSKIAKGDKK
jgi:hypothetical protein